MKKSDVQWQWPCGSNGMNDAYKAIRIVLHRISQRRWWHPTPVLLPGKSHGWRSLVGCSPWGREESDTTELLHFHFSLSCIGEGNGNPLQCSCLENPRDRGAWWATDYGVARSRTRLKWLSSCINSLNFGIIHQWRHLVLDFCLLWDVWPLTQSPP